jgi:AcrR family transcriptional regulator
MRIHDVAGVTKILPTGHKFSLSIGLPGSSVRAVEIARGLRERKKTATRQALHEAALRLAADVGPDCVTVEAIADAAAVSRRTFSNYFASKEEAFLYGDQVRMRLFLELVDARPTTESPWTALTRSARELYRRSGPDDGTWLRQSRLIRDHPALRAQQVTTYAALERELAAAVAARMPSGPATPLRARLVAAAFLAALRVAVQTWLDRPAGTSLDALVQRALRETGERFE